MDCWIGWTAIVGKIAAKMGEMDAEIVDAGMVDDPTKAAAAAACLKENDVELVFLYISTYALSSTVLPVVQRLGVPVIVLNLQPVAAIDYDYLNGMGDRGAMTGEWLAHCQACTVPEVACVFNRLGLKYEIVTGYLDEEGVWTQIRAWIDAARVAEGMRNNRMGVLGHYYCGMLDVYTDLTKMSGAFGTHFELLEMCELHELRKGVTDSETEAKIQEFETEYSMWMRRAPGLSWSVRPGRRSLWTDWWSTIGSALWPTITKGLRKRI